MKNVLDFAKQLLVENLASNSIVIDATVGNGNDTKFLCEHFKYVYGFDIQAKALQTTKDKLVGFNNYQLINASHTKVLDYVSTCDGAIFNLGYLPNASSNLTTNPQSTIDAIKKILTIIKRGIIVIVVYTKHDDFYEAKQLARYVSSLEAVNVIKYEYMNKKYAPYVIAIEKRGG